MRFPKSVFGGWHLNCPRQQTVRPAVHASEGAQQRHWSERDCQESGWAKAGTARAISAAVPWTGRLSARFLAYFPPDSQLKRYTRPPTVDTALLRLAFS